jgi:hypothetical protein
MEEFLSWFSNQTQYKHRIFIAGNHELKLEEENLFVRKHLFPDNCIYLQDTLIELEGINFYGTPVTPVFCNWAFNKTSQQLMEHFNNIPLCTEVLLTHGHIHHSYGTKTINNVQYVNSAIVGEDYKTRNKPITVNL